MWEENFVHLHHSIVLVPSHQVSAEIDIECEGPGQTVDRLTEIGTLDKMPFLDGDFR